MSLSNSTEEPEDSEHPHVMWVPIIVLYVIALLLDQSIVFFSAQNSVIPLAGGIAFIAAYRSLTIGGILIFSLSFAVSIWVGTTNQEAFIWSSINSLSAILGGAMVRKAFCDEDPFGEIKKVMGFILLAACIPYLLTCLLVWGLGTAGYIGLPDSLLIWWLGGTIGCVVSAPLLLPLLKTYSKDQVIGSVSIETIILLVTSGLLALTFSSELELGSQDFPQQYLIFPLMLWAILRKNLSIGIIILIISIMATLWGTTEGYGPFVRDGVAETSLLLQAFFGVASVTILFLHAAMSERRNAEQAVRRTRDQLEIRVEERTAELQESMNEAEEANKTKSRFLAAASHDLRQPIHAISLFSMALQARLKEKENAKLVTKVQGSLTSLGGMLDGLLDMSRLENDAIVPQFSDFSVQVILDQMITEHTPAAHAKGLDFRVVPSTAIIKSDRALLSRIMGNLVTNAIRYTDHGKVLIGCRKDNGTVRLGVWDTGRGIPYGDKPAIFDPYHRLDGAKKYSADGLGLGLAIVDGLAKLLDHQLVVYSKVGKGSRFSVDVKAGAENIAASGEEQAQTSYTGVFQDQTILVVDDDPDVLEGMQTVLTDWGCRVIVARDVESALTQVEALGDDLDAVISDYHLSEHDTGIAFLEDVNLRAGCAVPAIIITGDTLQERRHEIENAGYFMLTKPIQAISLRPLLRRQLRKQPKVLNN